MLDRELPARSVQREPEDGQHREHAVGGDAPAVGLAEQGDDDEVGERRHDLREVRQAIPGHGERAEEDQRVEDDGGDEHRRRLPLAAAAGRP